jgi:hypothetical protein
MIDAPDYLDTALYFAARVSRTRDAGERALLLAVAAKYRELAIAETAPFVMEMPKRPAASSVRRPAVRGQKSA